jgi:electron transfer flavoprotein alpha subunit
MSQEERNVWVFAEHRKGELLEVSLELLGEGEKMANRLEGEVAAILVGNRVDVLADTLAHYGARKVYLVEDEILEEYASDTYVKVIAGLIQQHRPRVFLAGATSQARDFVPRVAARVRMGFGANYSRLVINGEGMLQLTRPIYGGRFDGIYAMAPDKANSVVATAQPGAIGLEKPSNEGVVEIIRVHAEVSPQDIRTKVIDFIKGDPQKMDIRQAEIVVAAGRGIGSAEKFGCIEELAKVLGACIAGTRPATDAGWLPFERQVGQTGKTVSPKLYIACGISGAIQHTAGMKDSKRIIAVNNDSEAPIFKICDLGIVGDVHEVVPKLIARVRQHVSFSSLEADKIIDQI